MPKTSSSRFRELYDLADEELLPKEQMLQLTPLYQSLKQNKIRYTRWDPIGEGGMKEVFLVKDQQMERAVALARPKKGFQPERYDAFLREAHITARLDHPNIIKLFDMGIDEEERPYFTMEFKRGLSLRKILTSLKTENSSNKYPLERRLSIFVRICEAISYAHSRHVLHLDLKPENIQIGPFGEVQVCDWGIGEIAQGSSEEHLSEALLDPDLYGGQIDPPIKGTPGYMPPEQKNPREPKRVQNDIYALGCILYELVTLSSPSKRKKTPPQSPALAAIVSKACAQNPDERYQDAEDLLRDVNLHLIGRSPKVEQAGFFREARLFYRRNRVASLITLSSSLLLLGIGIWFTQRLQASYQEEELAHLEARNALNTAETEKKQSELARQEAEQALNKYQQEREFSSLLINEQSENAIERTLLLIDHLVMHESISLTVLNNAMENMDQALAQNPSKTERLVTLKAYTLFMQQKFEEASNFYHIRVGDQEDLRDLAAQFSPRLDSNGLLPADELIRLLSLLSKLDDDPPTKRDRSPFMEKIVIYDSLQRNNPVETSRILEHLLRISNLEWTHGIWKFDPQESSLVIEGTHLRTLYRPRVPHLNSTYPNLSLLRLLNLKKLTLRTPNLRNYEQLQGLSLIELDICKGPHKPLNPLVEMNSLRKIIISPGQFTEKELSLLPSRIEVIEDSTQPL